MGLNTLEADNILRQIAYLKERTAKLESFFQGVPVSSMRIGKISASKEETINAIKKHYIVPWTKVKYYNEAVADAISIYHAAITLSPTLKLLK